MDGRELLQVWDQAGSEVMAVIDALEPQDWARSTALPGWTVREVVAHLAHLESEAAGMPQPAAAPDVEARRNQPMPTSITEAGVAARADRFPQELQTELREALDRRRTRLAELDVSDLSAPAPGFAGELGWDLSTWLHNRPIDLWVHEQDIRRATGQATTTDTVGARHTAGIMSFAFPLALRRQPEGTTVIAEISGPQGRVLAARMGEGGRAAPFEPADGEEPDVHLSMTDETWLLLASGRALDDGAELTVSGRPEQVEQILERLNVTP